MGVTQIRHEIAPGALPRDSCLRKVRDSNGFAIFKTRTHVLAPQIKDAPSCSICVTVGRSRHSDSFDNTGSEA